MKRLRETTRLLVRSFSIRTPLMLAAACMLLLSVSPRNGCAEDGVSAEDGGVPEKARAGTPSPRIRPGYTPLFNGVDLTGWRNPYPHGQARVVDGEIHLTGDQKFFLVTDRTYDDFRLVVDIHLPEGPANSGVMFRCHVDDSAKKKVYGYQAECDGSDRRWSGGLYDESRRGWIWPSSAGRSQDEFLGHEKESKAFFKQADIAEALDRDGWNRFEVTCIEDRITITINGVTTTTFRDPLDARGHIGIQHHGEAGQTYRFRNLMIKELPVIPADETVSLVDQTPISVKRLENKNVLVDFGKVAFGNLAMRIPGGRPGMGVVHFGEKLDDGRIDRQPPGTVRYGTATFRRGSGERGTWIVAAPIDARNTEQAGSTRGHPPAVLTPKRWLPVMPFRWVEIEGWQDDVRPEFFTRRAAFASGWNDEASDFRCSDPTANRIWELCKYSIKATTFAGVYVDGDRERIPYEADAYLNQLSHYTTDDNVTMAAATFDWLIENGTWPTEWAPHMIFMAHAEYMHTGDREWLRDRYERLKSKTLLDRAGDDGLIRSDALDRSRHDIVDWPKKERDGFVFTEINTVVNAFSIAAVSQMATLAAELGKDAEAAEFADHARRATTAMNKRLLDPETGLYRDGVGTEHSSLHANLFPVAFGLVPADRLPGVVQWLGRQNMRCSVYAAQYFMEALFANGADRHAMNLILADGDRSWKHMVDSGTTITWEAWDMKYKGNQDWNHAWGAAPANLLPRFVLGVRPATPGWSRAVIRPCPAGLRTAGGRVPTPKGPVNVDWKAEDSTFTLRLQIPETMTAEVDLPAPKASTRVTVDGRDRAATRRGDRWIIDEPVTGNVEFVVQ